MPPSQAPRQAARDDTRTSVVPYDDLTAPTRNAIATHYEEPFRAVFAEPDDAVVGPLSETELRLYSNKRTWRQSSTTNPPNHFDHAYEAYIDPLFWKKTGHQLVIIEGDVGIGKSKFLRYYMFHYWPELGVGREHFKEKLAIGVNFYGVKTVPDFEKRLYRSIRKQLTDACDRIGFDLEGHDRCQMFDPILRFNTAVFQRAEEGDPQYREREVVRVRSTITTEKWVELALQYLSDLLVDPDQIPESFPYRYLVLCLDNLDQTPEDLHLRAI